VRTAYIGDGRFSFQMREFGKQFHNLVYGSQRRYADRLGDLNNSCQRWCVFPSFESPDIFLLITAFLSHLRLRESCLTAKICKNPCECSSHHRFFWMARNCTAPALHRRLNDYLVV
jgi:hypothetical protein